MGAPRLHLRRLLLLGSTGSGASGRSAAVARGPCRAPDAGSARLLGSELWCSALAALRHVGSSWIRDWTCVSCTGRKFFTTEPPGKPQTFSFFKFYFNWRLITLQYISAFCQTLTWISRGCTCVPHPEPPPPPSPSHPSGSSQCTSPEHPVIEPGLAICLTYDNIHVSTLPSQIIPPSPSPTESKRLLFTSVSFAISHIGPSLHLSKFHIYVLVYSIGVSLSDLLHSV